MRWIPYFILAYLAVGIHIGLSGYMNWRGASINIALLAAIFIAINAPKEAALIGCFALGAIQDLTTQQALGVCALSYGLIGYFAASVGAVAYRGHPATHFAVTLIGMLMYSAVVVIHGMIHGPRVAVSTLLLSSIYTAAVAPILIGILHRFRKVFSFQTPRRRVSL